MQSLEFYTNKQFNSLLDVKQEIEDKNPLWISPQPIELNKKYIYTHLIKQTHGNTLFLSIYPPENHQIANSDYNNAKNNLMYSCVIKIEEIIGTQLNSRKIGNTTNFTVSYYIESKIQYHSSLSNKDWIDFNQCLCEGRTYIGDYQTKKETSVNDNEFIFSFLTTKEVTTTSHSLPTSHNESFYNY